MIAPRKLASWERFVITNGWAAQAYELAFVVGQPVDAILRLRAAGVCSRLPTPKGFTELFTLWNGRDPGEDDWPPPRKMGVGGAYEWQAPEVAMLAGLVGQISQAEIVKVLTVRLREQTGDPHAERSANAIQVRTNKIGLQTTDVVGGLTISEAARDIGSFALVNEIVSSGELPTWRVGRLHVIPRTAWEKWKSKRVFPPSGYIQLSTLREALGIRSDKLSEFARMKLIPTAMRCNPYGTKAGGSKFGTWWISQEAADQLLADRRAGNTMPWHGKFLDNFRRSYALWEQRRHPNSCMTCAAIWGAEGAPEDFASYTARYTSLAHGAKRHLTRPWSPGLTLEQVADQSGQAIEEVRRAIANGVLVSSQDEDVQYVSRTAATRWVARKCPTGEGDRSWMSVQSACETYMFSLHELRGHIDAGELKVRVGTAGAARGIEYVSRHQCGQLREKIGFTEAQAAKRLDISIERFRHLVAGVNWRHAEKIPLVTVQAALKRLESQHGHTIEEAAEALGKTPEWVNAQIEKGVACVRRTRWDHERVYFTEPMLQRLRDAADNAPEESKPSSDWLSLSDAALEAGVSTTTLNAWGRKDELTTRVFKGVRYYHQAAVRARARAYWQTLRRQRFTLPAWLADELATTSFE